jgi:hypothetical protein
MTSHDCHVNAKSHIAYNTEVCENGSLNLTYKHGQAAVVYHKPYLLLKKS